MDNKNVRAGVGIMVLRDEKILLGKRNVDPFKASSELRGEGSWTMPGGKIQFGESIQDAAKRELKEETGIVSSEMKVVSVGNEIKGDAHFVTIGFLCDKFENEPKVMEPDEITEWRWFSLGSLPSPIFPPSMKLLQNYINGVIYRGD
ncbi:MAG: NUDIX domain-containing protein [Candidatus Aenigmatarchaeota archaeon]